MSAGQHIDYDGLVRSAILEAKRNVVRAVLTHVAKTGLVGGHHFLIAFNTQAPNVILSKRLREKYPTEMTIVLQHRFWDLEITDEGFEVKLTFDSIPERLGIPFAAIKAFYDPSVPYMMPFEEPEGDGRTRGEEDDAPARGDRRPRTHRRTRVERPEAEAPTEPANKKPFPVPADSAVAAPPVAAPVPATPRPFPTPLKSPPAAEVAGVGAKLAGKDSSDKSAVASTKSSSPDDSGKVLDLSSFRKKK